MAAGTYSFTIEEGTTTDFNITWADASGNRVNLAGYEAKMQIKTATTATSAIIALTSSLGDTYTKASGSAFLSLSGSNLSTPLSSGSIGVYIGHEITSGFSFTDAVYDIEMTSGSDRRRLLMGGVRLSNEVTTI